MEVKDVQQTQRTTEVQGSEAHATASRQRRIDSLTTAQIARAPEPVQLNLEGNPKTKQSNEARARANSLINVVNVAGETVGEIGRLIKSLDGIAEQAQSSDFPDHRRPVLESEANQLVDEIKRKALVSSAGVRPLAGDQIRFEIEEKLGKSLEVILPEGAADAFGLGQIKLDPKESIIAVRTAVAQAQQQLEALAKAVRNAHASVHDAVAELDVAVQNSEASQSSIRDVEQALTVAGRTGQQIAKAPDDALQSVGALDRNVLNLLAGS